MTDEERIKLQLDLGSSTQDAKKLADALDDVGEATGKAGTAADSLAGKAKATAREAKDAADAHDEMGHKVLSASYAVQDFVSVLSGGQGLGRALGAIQNNIPQLLALFGVGAGMAGVISVVSVGVGVLIDNFDKLHAAWSGGQTEAEIERLKKLAEAADKAREAVQKQADAARSQKGPTETKLGAAATAASSGPDFDKVLENIAGLDETEFARKRNELERQAAGYEDAAKKARRRGLIPEKAFIPEPGEGEAPESEIAAAKRAQARGADARRKIAELDQGRNNDEALVVRARGGDANAYDELLKRSSGDVHDQLAASDPRKVGMRAFNQQQARRQIGDAIGGVLGTATNALKQRRESEAQARNQAAAIDAQQDEAGSEAKRVLGRNRAEAEAQARPARELRNRRNEATDEAIRQRMTGRMAGQFQEHAAANGVDLSNDEAMKAAGAVMKTMSGSVDKVAAGASVLQAIVANQQAIAQKLNAHEQAMFQIQANAQQVHAELYKQRNWQTRPHNNPQGR